MTQRTQSPASPLRHHLTALGPARDSVTTNNASTFWRPGHMPTGDLGCLKQFCLHARFPIMEGIALAKHCFICPTQHRHMQRLAICSATCQEVGSPCLVASLAASCIWCVGKSFYTQQPLRSKLGFDVKSGFGLGCRKDVRISCLIAMGDMLYRILRALIPWSAGYSLELI